MSSTITPCKWRVFGILWVVFHQRDHRTKLTIAGLYPEFDRVMVFQHVLQSIIRKQRSRLNGRAKLCRAISAWIRPPTNIPLNSASKLIAHFVGNQIAIEMIESPVGNRMSLLDGGNIGFRDVQPTFVPRDFCDKRFLFCQSSLHHKGTFTRQREFQRGSGKHLELFSRSLQKRTTAADQTSRRRKKHAAQSYCHKT